VTIDQCVRHKSFQGRRLLAGNQTAGHDVIEKRSANEKGQTSKSGENPQPAAATFILVWGDHTRWWLGHIVVGKNATKELWWQGEGYGGTRKTISSLLDALRQVVLGGDNSVVPL
jgi:hypothetical protein